MVADRTQVSDGLYMTVEQYLALDESSDAKYEYLDGYVFLLRPPSSAYDDEAIDMAGGSIAHGAICAQLSYLLGGALRGKPCPAYSRDTRTKLSEKRYLHPDVLVACGEPAGPMLANPAVVGAVARPATQNP